MVRRESTGDVLPVHVPAASRQFFCLCREPLSRCRSGGCAVASAPPSNVGGILDPATRPLTHAIANRQSRRSASASLAVNCRRFSQTICIQSSLFATCTAFVRAIFAEIGTRYSSIHPSWDRAASCETLETPGSRVPPTL